MTNKKYHNVGTVPKYSRKIVEKDKINNPTTHIHDRLLSCIGTSTSIKCGGAKIVF